MTIVEHIINAAERAPLPDIVTNAGIHFLVSRTSRQLENAPFDVTGRFAKDMTAFPIALATDEANDQHYEIPASFFELILGSRRKYSCCYYETPQSTLDEAERKALALTAEHAGIAHGQEILELGCGWGSLTLWLAEQFPTASITAVSNSTSQRDYIMQQAASRHFGNVKVITADMNNFETSQRFDRVVSVEMFEHMANWRNLFERVNNWLRPDGRFFMHVFSHKHSPYRFDHTDKSDWIAQHFFTGGIMPSHDLVYQFQDILEVEQDWQWDGRHYAHTAHDWLTRFDRNEREIDVILNDVYGRDRQLWKRRWRLFFLATKGLFGHNNGADWGISHYRLRKS
jgi:cyclopropane-fatty-acyl-phospholipid synthase